MAAPVLPRTAVIGAGLSGLVTSKALADHGIDYTCFEAGPVIGGNWAFRNPNGRSSAYESLHIDTSKTRLQFEDFAIPERFPDFPHHTQILDYLRSYAHEFGLVQRIRLQTEVVAADRRDGGGWHLTLSTGDVENFDALVVANGHHWDPRWPEPAFPGTFTGIALHSHEYLNPVEPVDCRGKRVLVVGIGNSAVDIASELSRRGVASHVALSTRRGAHVIPKYVLGRPVDRVLATRRHVPLAWQRAAARALLRVTVGRMTDFGLPEPDHGLLEAHPTVSSELLLRLGSGDLSARPDIGRFDGSTVTFTDGSRQDFDVVVFATGYKVTFPFFDPGFLSAPDNRLPLFKRIVKPDVPDLAFVGLAQPVPTLFPFAEAQAKFAAAYFAGGYRLPDEPTMRATIRRDEKLHQGHFLASKRHTMQVDDHLYRIDLRRELEQGRLRAARREGIGPRAATTRVLEPAR